MLKARKRLCLVLIVVASVLVLSWKMSSRSPKMTKKLNINPVCRNRDHISDITSGDSSRWTPYLDILDYSVLKEPPLIDISSIANLKNSYVRIIDSKPFYNVGDEIKINIQLYDGLGRRREVGGDKIVVRIFEDSLQAGASGFVLDHKNGTYTAVVKCLWAGQPSISVCIDLTRETARMVLQYLDKNEAAVIFFVTYKDKDVQPCQPFIHWFDHFIKVCNMTERNGGMSWYCKAPIGNTSTCEDVYKFENRNRFRDMSTTLAEKMLNKQKPKNFPVIQIKVKDEFKNPYEQSVKPPCSTYNKTKLWFLPSPIGYFYKDKWIPEHCSMPSPDKFEKCLANRRMILYGDSTLLQWHTKLCKTYKCEGCENRPPGWKTDFTSYCKTINLTLDWFGHSLPGNIFRSFSNSPASHIFKYQNHKNMIFVIHLYSHLFRYHNSVFRDRIRHIRNAIETYLKVNEGATFFIKGPNNFVPGEIFRYQEYLFRVILIEEFRGLYDKVIYLDQHDVNIARNETNTHPRDIIVENMVYQMLAYICD